MNEILKTGVVNSYQFSPGCSQRGGLDTTAAALRPHVTDEHAERAPRSFQLEVTCQLAALGRSVQRGPAHGNVMAQGRISQLTAPSSALSTRGVQS